jgi:hypothetical protein
VEKAASSQWYEFDPMQEFGARYDGDLHERWDWTIQSGARCV